MKDFSITEVTTTRREYRMKTPAFWVDVEKMRTTAGQKMKDLLGTSHISDSSLTYDVGDDCIIISFETSQTFIKEE